MPTPAERVYEAAAGALADQQGRASRFTSAVAPVGATATAAALLLEPATNDIAHAQWPQVVGLVVGIFGLVLVFVVGVYLLVGADIKGVSQRLLYQTARSDGSLTKPDPFHLEAAVRLSKVWGQNRSTLRRFAQWFGIFIIGLVLELAGLGVAALVRPNRASDTTQEQAAASLHLTRGRLSRGGMSMTGALVTGAHGRVRISVSLLGRAGQVISLHPSIHDGRFKVRIRAARGVAPLRSATYAITWAGSSSVASAYLSGTIARCPGRCQ